MAIVNKIFTLIKTANVRIPVLLAALERYKKTKSMKKIYVLLLLSALFNTSATAQVVINEVYGGGGNSGAPYSNDFIELYNNGTTPVNLTGWSVQYTSATGPSPVTANWAVTNLTGTIQPGGFFLIQQAAGTTPTTALPTPDVTGTIGMGSTAGKVILCNVTTPQTGTNPTGTAIVDKVGYGATANSFETAPAPAPSNTTSISRTPIGNDTDNNSTNFIASSPTPLNSSGVLDITPPTVSSFFPSDDAINVAATSALIITFSENIKKNVGVISINNSTTNTTNFVYLETSNPNVTVAANVLTIRGVNLQPGNNYFITMADSIISDLANNKYTGINNNTTWNFSVDAAPPVLVGGILNNTYNLNTAANIFNSDGFKQYSTSGNLVWEATTFGIGTPATTGVQMNGFFSGTNVINEDWFISPSFDLSATTFPLLSFNSRTRFNGSPLQLKVSTNYSGYGNPQLATWTEVNGRFPAQSSDVWTLSNNINLSAYKTTNTYFAFVYNSTDDDGQRWRLDDIRIDNSATAPPASITTSASSVQFGYTASGTELVKTFTVVGNDITGDITLVAPPDFLLSTDNITYTSSITLTQATSNNVTRTVFVKFMPSQNNLNFSGNVTVATAGVTTQNVLVKATSVDAAKTLEVVNWNIEWFGSTTLGPTNEAQQEANVRTVLQNTNADIYGLVEVVDEARLANIVAQMPGYSYVICNYGSYVNPPNTNPNSSPLSALQKEAFVYKTSLFSNISTRPLINNNTNFNATSGAYYNYAGGRWPFLMTADVTLDGITKTIDFVLIHAKANTSPVTTSYNRRKAAADELRDTLNNSNFSNRNIIILGDFNDDLDVTIADGVTPNTTSYSAFTNEPANYFSPTLALSLAGATSSIGYSNMIDHVMLSNEMQAYYMLTTASVLTDVTSLINSYGNSTTDHYPIFTRYAFDPAILPVTLSSFTAIKDGNTAKLNWITEAEVNSKQFIVERSNDLRTWITVAKIQAQGTSSTKTNYAATDVMPTKGFNYYRLRTVDNDGKYTLSSVRNLLFGSNAVVDIAPNPAHNFVTIYINKNGATQKPVTVQLLNSSGKVVYNNITTLQQLQINTALLSTGLYVAKIITQGETVTKKVIIN
jgi:hypothetical protein